MSDNRFGRRDAPEVVGVVHDRRKEIRGRDQRLGTPQAYTAASSPTRFRPAGPGQVRARRRAGKYLAQQRWVSLQPQPPRARAGSADDRRGFSGLFMISRKISADARSKTGNLARGPATATRSTTAGFDEVIDVRSEGESPKNTSPAAVNCPGPRQNAERAGRHHLQATVGVRRRKNRRGAGESQYRAASERALPRPAA